MDEVTPLTEYGAPIDPRVMVAPPEATELELEPTYFGTIAGPTRFFDHGDLLSADLPASRDHFANAGPASSS